MESKHRQQAVSHSLSPGFPDGCRGAREQLAGMTVHLPSMISTALGQQKEVAAAFCISNKDAHILGYTVVNEGHRNHGQDFNFT